MALGTPVAGAAAYSANNGTTVSPAYPSGILASDVVLLFVGQKPSTANGGTVTTPTGWTLREELTGAGGYGTTLGADTGNTNLRVYSWNTPVAGQTGNLTVTLGTNNISWAFIVRIPNGTGAAEFGSADGQRTTTPTSPMAIALTNGASATNFQTGDRAIWAMCIPTDVTTPSQFSAQSITATGATFGTATELNEPDSGTGNDIGGYSAWAAVTAGSSTTAPTVTATLAGTLTNVRGPVVLLRVREAPATQTLTPTLYTNTQTFHNPTVTRGAVALTPSLYTNTQTFYSPDVTQAGGAQSLTPDLYTNTQTFYGPTATAFKALTPALYSNASAFFAPTVTASITLTPARYDNAQSFYGPTAAASYALSPTLYTNEQTFFAATVTTAKTLTPSLYTNGQTFFAPTISAASTVAPGKYDNAQTFYAPVVSLGAITLAPDLYSNGQAFYSATVAPGPVTLTPDRYDNANAFYAVTVSATYELAPALYNNANAFYAATVTTGAVTLTPDLFSNSNTFYAATVAIGATNLFPARYDNDNQFYAAAVATGAVDLQPNLVTNSQSFFAATVAAGPVYLVPESYVDDGYVSSGYVGPNTYSTQAFYSPTVSTIQYLVPARFNNASTFYGQRIYQDRYTITLDQARLLFEIYLLHGLVTPSPLSVSPTARSAGPIQQSVAEASGVVTINTTAQPTYPDFDPGLMITELAALHGIGETLTVTSGTRVAGAISQVFGAAGSATTVTRQ